MNGAGETLDEGYNRKCISCQQPTPTGPICERCQRGGRRPRSKSFSQAEMTQFAIERQQAPPPLSPRGVVSNPMMMMRGGMNNLPMPMSARPNAAGPPPPVMRAAYPQPSSSLATTSSPSNNTPVVASSMLPMSAMPAYRPSAPTGPPLYHQPSARSPPLPGMSMRSYPQPVQQQQQQQQQQQVPPVQVQRPVLGGSGASQAALRYEPITASNEAESSRNMTMSDFDDDNDRDALGNDASALRALSSSAPTAARRRSASLTSIETDGRLDAARQVGVDGSLPDDKFIRLAPPPVDDLVSTVSTGQSKTNRCCEQCGFVKLCTKTMNEKGKQQMLCLSCRLETLKRCRELGLLRQNSRGFSLRGLFSKDKKKSSGGVTRSQPDLSASANVQTPPAVLGVSSTSSAPALLGAPSVNMPPSQPTLYEEPRVSPDGWNAPDPQQGGWNNPPDQGGWNNPSVDPQWAASQRDNFPASRVGDGGSLKMPPSGHRPSKPLADVSQITGSYRPSQNNLTNGGGGGYPNPGDLDNSNSMSGRRGPSQPAFGNGGGGGAGAGAGGGSPNWGRQPAQGMSFHPGAPSGGMAAAPRVRAQTTFDTRNGAPPPGAAPPYGGAAQQPPFGGVGAGQPSPPHADARDIYGQLSLVPARGNEAAAGDVYGQLNLNPQRY